MKRLCKDYWDWRAERLNLVGWVRHITLSDRVSQLALERGSRPVLDVGCGTGIMVNCLTKEGLKAIGLDISRRMILEGRNNGHTARCWMQGDARNIPLGDEAVGTVLMRMVLHNVVENTQLALVEAHRVLRRNGLVIVVEGVPPRQDCAEFFRSITLPAHERVFFSSGGIGDWLSELGFKSVETEKVVLSRQSVKGWLNSSVENPALRKELLHRHLEMPQSCRDAYRASVSNSDVLIDLHFEITTARKP